MYKISNITKELVRGHSFYQFGLHSKIFNISRLARFIRPLVETRLKKPVKTGAIAMALSRLQKGETLPAQIDERLPIKSISIHPNLCSISYFNNKDLYPTIGQAYSFVQKKKGYISVIQGIGEITIIVEEDYSTAVVQDIKQKPKNLKHNISAIHISLDESYHDTPGLLFNLIQSITFQGVNILDVSSTFSELIVYIDQKDMKLVFDTITTTQLKHPKT